VPAGCNCIRLLRLGRGPAGGIFRIPVPAAASTADAVHVCVSGHGLGEFMIGVRMAVDNARKAVAAIAVFCLMVMFATVQVLGAAVHARADATGIGGDYVAVPQAKVLDTRTGTGGVAVAPMAWSSMVTVPVAGHAGIPSTGVGAVLVDVTAINPSAGGYIRLYPSDQSAPSTSSLTYDGGQTASNSAVVAVGHRGRSPLRMRAALPTLR